MRTCSICNHEYRSDIDERLMKLSKKVTMEMIADEFDVNIDELKSHALMHSSVGVNGEEEVASIVNKIGMREADILGAVIDEYYGTLKNLGRRINRVMHDEDMLFEKIMTKAVVDLYIGVGSEIRSTVKVMSELDQALNGADNGSSGLHALANAISGIKKPKGGDEEDD